MDLITLTLSDAEIIHGRTLYVSAEFTDAGNPDTPDSTDYKVEDVATNTLLRDWTPAVPATSTSVQLEGADTDLLTATDLEESRRVTFRATKGTTNLTANTIYLVINPQPVSSQLLVSLDCNLTPQLERYLPLPSSRISRVVELDNWNP